MTVRNFTSHPSWSAMAFIPIRAFFSFSNFFYFCSIFSSLSRTMATIVFSIQDDQLGTLSFADLSSVGNEIFAQKKHCFGKWKGKDYECIPLHIDSSRLSASFLRCFRLRWIFQVGRIIDLKFM